MNKWLQVYTLLFLYAQTLFSAEALFSTEVAGARMRGIATIAPTDSTTFFELHGGEGIVIDPFTNSLGLPPAPGSLPKAQYQSDGTLKTTAKVINTQEDEKSTEQTLTKTWYGKRLNKEIYAILPPLAYTSMRYASEFVGGPAVNITAELERDGIHITRSIAGREKKDKYVIKAPEEWEGLIDDPFHPPWVCLHPHNRVCAFPIDKKTIRITTIRKAEEDPSFVDLYLAHSAQCSRGLGPDKLVFGPGNWLATELHGQVKVWNSKDRTKVFECTPTRVPFDVGGIIKFDTSRHEQQQEFRIPLTVMAFNPDPTKPQFLLTQGRKLILYDYNTGEMLKRLNAIHECAGFTASGKYYVVADKTDKHSKKVATVTVYNSDDHTALRIITLPKLVTTLCCSPHTGDAFAFSTPTSFYVCPAAEQARVRLMRRTIDTPLSQLQWCPRSNKVGFMKDNKFVEVKLGHASLLSLYLHGLEVKGKRITDPQKELFYYIYQACKKTAAPIPLDISAMVEKHAHTFNSLPPCIKERLKTAYLVENCELPPYPPDYRLAPPYFVTTETVAAATQEISITPEPIISEEKEEEEKEKDRRDSISMLSRFTGAFAWKKNKNKGYQQLQ